MKISEQELSKIAAMLHAYKQEHGTIAISEAQTVNQFGCTGTCTNSCSTYCDGSRCFCWKSWKGNG